MPVSVIEILPTAVWIVAIPAIFLMLIFGCEVWLGIGKTKEWQLDGVAPDTCILVPAHNESQIILGTLASLQAALPENARILIVADNCTDDTAAVVREAGFEVIERYDTQKKGKGFALAFGRDHLRATPPECVIVIDADCQSDARSLQDLACLSCETGAAVQACYVLAPSRSAPPKVQVSSFAFWIKNVVRQRGAYRFGGGAILTGTGMALPWKMFEGAPLASGSIVEDLSLTVDLVRSGSPPIFFEHAKVSSPAASEQATVAQRSRWEHGFLEVATIHAGPLLKQGLASIDRRAFLLGLHLLVPPFTLLFAACFVVGVLLALTAAYTSEWNAFFALAATFAFAIAGVFCSWLTEGHKWLSVRAVCALPRYILWKLPVYARFFSGKRAGWIRTERD